MSMVFSDYDDIAGNYVLGLLSQDEAKAADELIADDPALAARVAALQDDFLPLDLSAKPVDLPEGFAVSLIARLNDEPRGAESRQRAGKPTVTTGEAANQASAPWNWRGLAAGVVLGALIGVGGYALRPQPQPLVVAIITNEAGEAQAVIEDYGNDTVKVRFVADIDVPEGSIIQAWTLPSAEMGPRSLGVLPETVPTDLSTADLPRPGDAQLYELTLEPAGGSPTGRPTGPILGKGLAALQI